MYEQVKKINIVFKKQQVYQKKKKKHLEGMITIL